MADLSTINTALPADTDLVSEGASRMRELRAAVVGSVDLEHTLTGRHQFPYAGTASRPTVEATAGQLFLNSDRGCIEASVFGLWGILRTVPMSYVYTAGAIALGTSYGTIGTLNIDSPGGGHLLVLGFAQITWAANPLGVSYSCAGRFYLDSTELDGGGLTNSIVLNRGTGDFTTTSMETPYHLVGAYTSSLAEGNHTLLFQMRRDFGPTCNASKRFMAYLVL